MAPTTLLLLALLALVVVAALLALRRFWWWREVEVLSLDGVDLSSDRLGLTGRPDGLIRLRSGAVIPQERISGRRTHPSYKVQLGTYFLLIEEAFGRRPPFGHVVLDGDSRRRIRNTRALRRRVLRTAAQVRRQRAALVMPVRVRPKRWQCKGCGYRDICTRAMA